MSSFVTIVKAWDPTEAELVRGLLESNGIPVFVSRSALGELYGLTVSKLASIEVMVPNDRVDEATELLGAAVFTAENEADGRE